eukprot:361936-Chlamydomonas_euryale.AAC.1
MPSPTPNAPHPVPSPHTHLCRERGAARSVVAVREVPDAPPHHSVRLAHREDVQHVRAIDDGVAAAVVYKVLVCVVQQQPCAGGGTQVGGELHLRGAGGGRRSVGGRGNACAAGGGVQLVGVCSKAPSLCCDCDAVWACTQLPTQGAHSGKFDAPLGRRVTVLVPSLPGDRSKLSQPAA